MKFLSTLLAGASRWIRRPVHSPCAKPQVMPQVPPCAARTRPAPAAVDDFSLEKFDVDQIAADSLPRYALSDQNFVVDKLELTAALDRGQIVQR